MTFVVRTEQPVDTGQIFEVTRLAFSTAAHTSGTEQFIVDALRQLGHMALSLVAIEDETLVGHIAFSPVTVSSGEEGWYGIGPLSVLPEFQRKGVGSCLMEQGMAQLQQQGAKGGVLVGDPAYYSRFGFAPCSELVYLGIPPEYVLVKSFSDKLPNGEVVFSKAFEATA
ncbi:GNAT family N-acetyltransferase [Dechloromonas hortensis]|uniref:GNAT family N-acetyltransferase n=1 Tax=Dechloromonas hortensis TaxID=337779 RepID=UPI001292BB63|nr:N-acetyltransferase [Dechloromonas hortensis]